jgi:hypothetical protein
MFRRIFVVVSVSLLVLFFSLTAEAQQGTAAITGVVTDSSGAIIPGVNVTLRNPQTGVTLKAKTESAGAYTIKLVPPGPGYIIKFEAPGFSATEISGLYLNVDTTRTQDTKLQAGANYTIEVSAANQNETLNTTDAQIGTSVEVQVLNELPVQDRDSPSALFTLLPGITSTGATTGARTDQTNVTLDGLDVNDNETGNFKAIVANAPIDSVEEFHGLVAGQLSSSGEGGGGQFQMVTKGGTNHFHGSLYEYHRDTAMEANDWFYNNEGLPRTPLIRNQFGGSIGGPVLKDKLYFFFSYQGSRITQSSSATRTIPLPGFRAGTVTYDSTNGGTNTLSAAQVASLDPKGLGFNSSLLSLISSRYPGQTNNSSYGDGLNTSGYTFTYPAPSKEDNYTQRVDYKMTPKVSFEGVGHFTRANSVRQSPNSPQFPGDPETFPDIDQSYSWAGINTWVIGSNKTNQFEVGETYENYSFPCTYNPEGNTQFGSLGGNGSGGSVIDGPYAGCGNAQGRTYPILMIKDDFTWTKGRHDITLGGQIKRISPNNFVILNYNGAGMGLGGFVNSLSSPTGTPSLRPADLATSGNAVAYYDQDYALALAPYTSTSATYNYNSQGQALSQGSGANQDFRFYETEIYAGDTWKATPHLTLTYGVRWQYYTVPYERHGLEALAHFGSQSISDSTFNYYFGQRLTDAANGVSGNTALPLISYVLGGKANGGQQSYYAPEYHDFAPRVAFAYTPSFDEHTVWRGGAGLVYDHTVVSAIQYQQTQFNYLFKNSVNDNLGIQGNAYASLQALSRFGGLSNPPTPPSAPAVTPPYYPWVNNPTSSNPDPVGLLNGEFNETVDPHFKTPFSVLPTFGMQHEFQKGFILKADYVGRFGRRLMAQADMSQLVDFPDKVSGQTMSQAYSNLVRQTRACQAAGTQSCAYTAQPWFENVLGAGSGVAAGYANNTQLAANIAPYVSRGDFADWLFSLAGTPGTLASGYALPANIGMASQFAENTVYTNKGFSSYNGLLVTVHKNSGFGLTYDINYTWSHSVDNVSVTANTVAYGGYGFICDVVRPRSCRGNSDFDISNQVNGYVTYDLPFGHGRMFGGSSSWLVNELAGGWSISALPAWHTGTPYFAGANAFVAGFANNAAAILTGNKADMNVHLNGGKGQTLYAFANPTQAVNDYEGPIGFQVGSRNNLRGPRATTLDAGVSKSFPIVGVWVFKLRGDAFNVMNHPVFANPNVDITESSNPFGAITADATGINARVLQVSGRIEF